jgi:hypothetical protein
MSAQDYTAEGQGFESCCLSQHGKGNLNKKTVTQNFIYFTDGTHILYVRHRNYNFFAPPLIKHLTNLQVRI